MWETQVQSLGWEDALEKKMATHSSVPAWRITWTEEPGRLQSMGSQGVRHNSVTFTGNRDHLWRPREVRRLSPSHPGKEGLILISSIRLCCPPSAPLLLPPLDVPGQPSCPLAPLSSPSVKTPSHCLQLLILFLLRPLLALVFFHPQLWVCRSLGIPHGYITILWLKLPLPSAWLVNCWPCPEFPWMDPTSS